MSAQCREEEVQAGCEARVRAALTLRVDLLDGVEEDVRVDDALIALLGDEDAWIVVSHPQHSVLTYFVRLPSFKFTSNSFIHSFIQAGGCGCHCREPCARSA